MLAGALVAGIACGGGESSPVPPGPSSSSNEEAAVARGAETPFPGYTLFQPLRSTSVYLVDMDGELAHRWETEYNPGHAVYFLPSGNLLRAARDPEPSGTFRGGGEGGIIQEIAADGAVLWEFELSDETRRQHHDIEPMPGGNVLIVAWESRTYEEAVQAGINPARMVQDEIWPDVIVEVEPVYPDGGRIVWEWRAWDHLVQELYADKDNYGIVAEHPELIDINAAPAHRARQEIAAPEALDRLRALGYIAGDVAGDDRPQIDVDWIHTNSVDYNAELDQILLSSRHFSEIWILDHGTTTEEAAGHTGGRYGKGGDLLYRWGNPQAWGVGGPEDRTLFVQHDARWIEERLPGEGNILIFNNGAGRPDLNYSSVIEIAPPMNADGSYRMPAGEPTGPHASLWEYVAADAQDFFSAMLSGAQRLPNGNTLVAAGQSGWMFEVGAGDAVVWEFTNPYLEDEDRLSSARVAAAFGAGERGGRGPRPPRPGAKPGRRAGGPNRDPVGAGEDADRRGGAEGPGIGGMSPPGGIFRATRIPLDHPGLSALLQGEGRDR